MRGFDKIVVRGPKHVAWFMVAALVVMAGAVIATTIQPHEGAGHLSTRLVASSTATPPAGACAGLPGILLSASAVGPNMALMGPTVGQPRPGTTTTYPPGYVVPPSPFLWEQYANYASVGAPPFGSPGAASTYDQTPAAMSQIVETVSTASSSSAAEQWYSQLVQATESGLSVTTILKGSILPQPSAATGVSLGEQSTATVQDVGTGAIVQYVVLEGDSVLDVGVYGGPANTPQSDLHIAQAALAQVQGVCGPSM